jgi:hypothetical protein
MLVHQLILVMGLVARNAEIGIFGLAVFSGDVVLTQLAGYFLSGMGSTSLSSRYLDSLIVKWTM